MVTREEIEEFVEWYAFVVIPMFFLFILGTGLNNTVMEWKELGTETPGHCVWRDWQEGCS